MISKQTCAKWGLPVSSVVLGGVGLIAYSLGGNVGLGLSAFGIMTAFGLFVLLAGRSETIRGLRGDGRDERFAQIDMRATAFTGLVMMLAAIAAWLTEIAHGHSGNPYQWLLAIGGLAYVLAVAFLRWRT